MASSFQILGISGSLRKHSLNSAALRAAQQLLPDGAAMELFDLAPIPIYNEDVRAQGFPDSVQLFRDRIAAADAVLFSSPEYNYSIPGPLKNAIDWASRPPSQPFDCKPIALMGASPGSIGTARCQYQMRQVFVYLNGMVLNQPEVMIASASDKFDDQGNLIDAITRDFIRTQMAALVDWAHQLRSGAMAIT